MGAEDGGGVHIGERKEKNKHRETNIVEWTNGNYVCLFGVVGGEEAD